MNRPILMFALLLPVLARGAEEPATLLPPRRFDQLSERSVSRLGEAALQMKGVTWEHRETDHFIFHTATGFSVPQLASLAQRSYDAVKQDLGVTQDVFERKCHVYVFLDENAWREFTRNGHMDPWTGGWCTGRELFLWSRPHFKFQGPTLPHEITHLVVHRFLGGDMPLWLNEGFAEFEGIRIFRGYLKARDYRLVGIADRLARARYVPLAQLTSALDYPSTKEEVEAFYIESQRLVHFLYHENGGLEPLVRFMKQLTAGARFDSALREVYGDRYHSVADFEAKFLPYLTKEKP